MRLKVNLKNLNIGRGKIDKDYDKAIEIMRELRQASEPMTEWVRQPASLTGDFILEMESTAEEIRSLCEVLIVIGVGGSYLGTAAVAEALEAQRGCPQLVYAGHNLSGNYLDKIVKLVQRKETCLCVVSKSGNTMETRIAFDVLKEAMYSKYGDEATKRIIAVTDSESGSLREEAKDIGYRTFAIPADVGGRYSAFTAGTLFPLAVAGANIREFIQGAKDIAEDIEFWEKEGVFYALARESMYAEGKSVEVFEFYDPSLALIGEWCEQLFGESEGKDGKGLFPTTMIFSRDLHSMGQFLQEGNQIFFETMLSVRNWDNDIILPTSKIEYLSGKSLNEINQIAMEGVVAAHSAVGIPIVIIEIEDNKEYSIGQLLYFFMMVVAVTGKLIGIDPFNQPGVEAYKSEIGKRLGKKS